MLSRELLEVLACPKCKGDVAYEKEKSRLTCSACRLHFKILEGDIPDMLIEDAEKF